MQKQLRVLIIVAAMLALFSGVASAYDGTEATSESKRVDVLIDGKQTKTVSINSKDKTVAEILELAGIEVAKEDTVTPGINALIGDNTKIEIKKPFDVTVVLDGVARYLRTEGGTIKDIKEKIEESAGVKTTLVGAEENAAVVPEMTVELVTRYTEKEEVQDAIPFDVVYVDNNELLLGTENVLTEGTNGVMLTVFELTYEGGELISKVQKDKRAIVGSVDKVIERGTKNPKPTVPDVPELDLVYTKVFTAHASAYTSDRGDAGTHTATGERARVGLVAVDPKVIPLGTMLYIEDYGIARAADTGGMIKGEKVDLYFNTYEECVNFGRQNVVVYILEEDREEIAAKMP